MHLRGIDTNLIVALHALLVHRNVTRAGKEIGLSQSSMSHALSRLRAHFDDPLLVAVGRELVPSERAKSLTGPVEDAVARLENVFTRTRPFDPRTSERVFRIAATDNLGLFVLPRLAAILDMWCGAGHHVGNHTHYHCALNWCSIESYERDMDRSESILRPWIEHAPTRYFRFAFDMWGEHKDKTDRVLLKLAKSGFQYAPISMWFSDTFFMVPHFRALAQKSSRVVDEIEALFVEQWMAQLKSQADGARAAMGRDVTHVALIHGTPLGGATMGRICQRMVAEGVEFVSLEEAMRDPFNTIVPPLTERRFRNFTQKWCEVTNTPLEDMPPRMLHELGAILPIPGMDESSLFGKLFIELGAGVDGKPVLADFLD